MAFPGVAAGHGLLQLDQWMFCKTCGKNPANQSNPWAGESSFSPYETRGAAGGEVTLTPRHVAGDGPGDLVERSNDDLSGHVTM